MVHRDKKKRPDRGKAAHPHRLPSEDVIIYKYKRPHISSSSSVVEETRLKKPEGKERRENRRYIHSRSGGEERLHDEFPEDVRGCLGLDFSPRAIFTCQMRAL